MGKKKNKQIKTTTLNLGGKKLIEFHTSCLNKHGELKGKNKKETKVIKDTCMHHKVGKKGKLKSRVNVNDQTAHCTMCDHDFPATLYDKEERNRIINDYREFVDHTKFVAASIGAGEDTLRCLGESAVSIENVKKINKKCTKIVRKEDQIAKKKKKNKDNGNSKLGSWNVRNR